MTNSLIDLLLRTGRPGGVVSILLGLVLILTTVLGVVGAGWIWFFLPGLGGVLILFGVLLVVHGDPEDGSFQEKEAAPPSPELLEALSHQPRPFFLCTRCRQIGEVGLCPRCKKGLDCVEIRDDEDLRLALLALS